MVSVDSSTPSPPETVIFESPSDVNHKLLKVDKPDSSGPSSSQLTSPKKKSGNTKPGEMPDWMVKFVQTNNITVKDDVKFPDSS